MAKNQSYIVPNQTVKDAEKFADINAHIFRCRLWLVNNSLTGSYINVENCKNKIIELRKQARKLNSKFRLSRVVN